MPPTCTTEGHDAACVIRAESPDTGVLVLSAHVEVEHVTELLVSGRAIGYLDMSRVIDVADFVDALERIAKGASVVDPHSFRRWSRLVGATTLWRCFAREQEVVMLMAEGPVETQVSPGGCGS